MNNSDKIILDLCGGTGSWSLPYKEAGYDVRLITLPEHDILIYKPPSNVYGVLAAPPCTDFSVAGCQYWSKKDATGQTVKSLAVVNRCFEIAKETSPKFFVLENPRGCLPRYIGEPSCRLNYLDFGCSYFKTVFLWGYFSIPIGQCYAVKGVKAFVKMRIGDLPALPDGYDFKGAGMSRRAAQRSITYGGFAEAFFRMNP
jgi:hypothetical protein